MRKYLIFPLIFCAGCVTLDRKVIVPVTNSWNYIAPQYIEYVQNDVNLSDKIKQARIDHANELTALLKDANKLIGE